MNDQWPDSEYLKTITILYVEDDEDVREQLAVFLKRRAGRLITASDGAVGLELFCSERPNLVVADILVPVMDGLAMAREIRRLDPAVPIIITTAFEKTDYLLRSIDAGVDRYVLKPVNMGHFNAALLDCAYRLRTQEQIKREMELRKQSELALKEAEVRQQMEERFAEVRGKIENEERARISRDIHDSIGQSLAALKLNLKMLQKECVVKGCNHSDTISNLVGEVTTASKELRDIIIALQPAFLATTTLDKALWWLCERFEGILKVEFVASGDFGEISKEVKLAFFRICQEAFNNVVKHAQATGITVSLINKGHVIRLVIQDNGRGGIASETSGPQKAPGFGLSIMRERMALVKGRLAISSSPDSGTTVALEAPLSGEQP